MLTVLAFVHIPDMQTHLVCLLQYKQGSTGSYSQAGAGKSSYAKPSAYGTTNSSYPAAKPSPSPTYAGGRGSGSFAGPPPPAAGYGAAGYD